MPRPLLFPLNRISTVDVAALQAALRPAKLMQPAFMRQRIRGFQLRLAPDLPVNRPWNAASSRFGITDVATEARTMTPSVVHQLLPIPPTQFGFIGISRDSTGAALGNCTVKLYRERDDFAVETTVSDANGNYRFKSAQRTETYYVRWYLAGSPDRAGTSKNALVAS